LSTYDSIAPFYDVDMARNMPFDDVGFYANLGAAAHGPVLELGCGNGRLLLPLLRRGIDAEGVDASPGMLAELKRKAAALGLPAPVQQMDMRELALAQRFALVLCPYSLVTYCLGDDDLRRLFDSVRAHLAPDGRFVVDAFVPQPPSPQDAEFRLDYRRPWGDTVLSRWRRLRPESALVNRIERRYEVTAADGSVRERIDVEELVRPFAPDVLLAAVVAGGFVPEREWWDYGTRPTPEGARFFTLEARPPRPT
jgi:SAM-dependent methyltransferase